MTVNAPVVGVTYYTVFTASTDHETNVQNYVLNIFASGVDPLTGVPVLRSVVVPVGSMGLIYTVSAALLGTWFLAGCWRLWRSASAAGAIRIYRDSITYLTGLFGAIALDALLTIRF